MEESGWSDRCRSAYARSELDNLRKDADAAFDDKPTGAHALSLSLIPHSPFLFSAPPRLGVRYSSPPSPVNRIKSIAHRPAVPRWIQSNGTR